MGIKVELADLEAVYSETPETGYGMLVKRSLAGIKVSGLISG